MSREIKFRAWDIENKEWSEEVTGVTINGEPLYNGPDDTYPDVILMQYTGLKDKNGKEIYEGDIVRVPTEINKDVFGEWSLREIKYNNGGFLSSYLTSEKGQIVRRGYTASFIIEEPNIDTKRMLWGFDPVEVSTFEVVGNVYENADLIK